MVVLFLLVFLRRLLRLPWLATAAFALLGAIMRPSGIDSGRFLIDQAPTWLAACFLALVVSRFGMLCLYVALAWLFFTMNSPLILGGADGYVGPTLFILGAAAAVGLYGLTAAVSGHRSGALDGGSGGRP